MSLTRATGCREICREACFDVSCRGFVTALRDGMRGFTLWVWIEYGWVLDGLVRPLVALDVHLIRRISGVASQNW